MQELPIFDDGEGPLKRGWFHILIITNSQAFLCLWFSGGGRKGKRERSGANRDPFPCVQVSEVDSYHD